MASLPYMQFYVSDYLADTAHLSTEEHGAYMLLIMNYWQRGNSLPNNDKRLALITRLSNERWTDVKETLKEFFNVTETEWVHDRIERDLESVKNKSTLASEAGKASAAARKAKKLTNQQQDFNERSTDVATDVQQNVNHTDKIRTDKIRTDKNIKISCAIARKETDENFEKAWAEYPKRAGGNSKPDARKAWNARCKEGCLPEKMIEGVIRYRKFCEAEGKIETTYVKQAATFFGPSKHFDEQWELPKKVSATQLKQNSQERDEYKIINGQKYALVGDRYLRVVGE